MKNLKKKIGFVIIIIFAIASVVVDILIKSNCTIFNEVNRILLSTVTVIAGFWVTSYLLLLQLYKDRYPLKFIKENYLPQMKYNFIYIIYSIIFGCFVVIKSDGVIENIWFATVSLLTIIIVLRYTYNTSKIIMVNSYVDEFCDEISNKLKNQENCIKANVFEDLRYVLDECIVREEYFVVQNMSKKIGEIFREFLKNTIDLIDTGEETQKIEDSFERIVEIGIYQMELCKGVSSELLISDIGKQQFLNIKFCIKSNQYEWFKKYIKEVNNFAFQIQRDNNSSKVVDELFSVYDSILKTLINENDKNEWIKLLIDGLFSMCMSLNYLNKNRNLKNFASTITYSLICCCQNEKEDIFKYIYSVFEKFTDVTYRISNGFSDITLYYALYFREIIKKKDFDKVEEFFKMIFVSNNDKNEDNTWTEFKFYCIKEVQVNFEEEHQKKIRKYHIMLMVDIIELKEHYKGYIFLPDFQNELRNNKYSNKNIEEICGDIKYLFNKSIINDNLNFYFLLMKMVSECLVSTEAQYKDIQINLFEIYLWLIKKTKKLNNKQFIEILFGEIEDIINELDKAKYISNDFGDKIICELTEAARHSDSDSQLVVLYVIGLFSTFLSEGKELSFVSNSLEKKEKLYKGLFNIGTNCIENDFEEGLRRASNTLGWYIVYSIKQGNNKLTCYLIKLASDLFLLSKDMQVSAKTQTFILTLFTTVGTYCCKESTNYHFIENILSGIQHVEQNQIYTAIKLRTSENDMWDDLFDNKTTELTSKFKKKYDNFMDKHKSPQQP